VNLDDYRTLFLTVTLILILGASTPVIGMFLPRSEEPFFVLALLGERGMADHYYPNGDPNIGVGSPVRWYLYLYNHMDGAQYVAVRVKVLNSTLPAPDSALCCPSPVPHFFEFRRVLVKNETWISPFFWRVSGATYQGDMVAVTQLVVNNVTLSLDTRALGGHNFRLVFELWVYDDALGVFRFGWRSGQDYRCAWNQIWFNVA